MLPTAAPAAIHQMAPESRPKQMVGVCGGPLIITWFASRRRSVSFGSIGQRAVASSGLISDLVTDLAVSDALFVQPVFFKSLA